MLQLSETERLIQQSAAQFRKRRLEPIASQIDRDGTIPDAVLRELAELGLMGVNVPEVNGGAEAGTVAYALAMMEIGRGCAATSVTMAVTNMVSEVLVAFGSKEQQAARLPPILRGDCLGAFALSEAEAGSDPGALKTQAVRATVDGEAGYRLTGSKQWISHADRSGTLIVWARLMDQAGGGGKGLTCFLLDGEMEGLSIPGKEEKLGLRGSHTCALALDDVWIPESERLGDEGDGFRIAMMALDGGRIGIASQSIGIGEAALAQAVAYSKERRTFGSAIAEHQGIQIMLADSRTELDAARLLTLRAAALKDAGQPFTKEASMAKLFATEKSWAVCDRALQVHGGYGYTRDFPLERHLRDVRVTRIYEGTSEIQRMVIAREVIRSVT